MPGLTPPVTRRLLLWLGLACATCLRAAEADLAQAWELVSRHLANDALHDLQARREKGDREAAFAEAVVRLDSQPVTEAGLKKTEAQLTELARGSDEVAEASAYLVGRLYQVHFFIPDYARAARTYEQLAESHPGSYWAQLGLVKLALLRLYVLPEPADPVARVAAAEALLARVKIPDLQRDLHIVIGRAQLFHDQPMDGVLAHLIAADQIGGLTGLKRVELQLQIGELSMRAKQWDVARDYFQRFLAENDVDGRCHTVKMKLAEIAARQQGEGRSP